MHQLTNREIRNGIKLWIRIGAVVLAALCMVTFGSVLTGRYFGSSEAEQMKRWLICLFLILSKYSIFTYCY